MATTRPATAGQRRAPTDRRRGLRPNRPRPPLEPRHHPIPAPLARALFPRSQVSLCLHQPERRAPPAEPRSRRAHTPAAASVSAPSDALLALASPSSVARLLLGPRRRLLHLSPRAPTRHRHSRRRLAVESPLGPIPRLRTAAP
ncbi:hypothetical protein U9M48_007334 [Paspalum notatum var. saurae]|uniref:Uncharacterized protein n=1 Tax=Paspalum notatum var. saurae TaxID=547442 RepID=A0AAQ3PRJ3_PASNO